MDTSTKPSQSDTRLTDRGFSPTAKRKQKYESYAFEACNCKVSIDGNNMTIKHKEQHYTLRKQMTQLENVPYDITLQVGSQDSQVKAHKNLLVDKVEYFRAMFSENFKEASQSVIELSNFVDFQTVSRLIGFLYKGVLQVDSKDVQKFFQLSDIWGMTGINSMCVKFMEWQLDVSNCLDLQKLAESHCCQKLIKSCSQVICHYFQALINTEAFLELTAQELSKILQQDGFTTGTKGEDILLEAVLWWYKKDKVVRSNDLEDLLDHIKMAHVSSRYKRHLQDDPCLEFLQKKFECQSFTEKRSSSHYAIVIGDAIVIGGYLQSPTGPFIPRTASVEKFDPYTNEVTFLGNIPSVPNFGVAVNMMGYITYIAVHTCSEAALKKYSHTTEVYVYNALFDIWRRDRTIFSEVALNTLSVCLMNGGDVTYCDVENVIYAVSVQECVAIKVKCQDGEIFCNVVTNLPSLMTSLDERHCSLKGVAHKGQLFVMGGEYGPLRQQQISSVVFALSEDQTQWLKKSNMLNARKDFAVVSFGDELFVTGGYRGRNPIVNIQVADSGMQKCERYSVIEDRWRTFALMQQSKTLHSTIVMNDRLYTFGGKTYGSQKDNGLYPGWCPGVDVSNFIEVADPSPATSFRDHWKHVASLKKSRCFFSVVVV